MNLIQKVKANWDVVLMGLILTVGLVVRVNLWTYPTGNDLEMSRDYLIGRHIWYYHDFPKSGPLNGVFGATLNSPVYFYIVGLMTGIYDSIVFLSYVNIFLQLATGVLLYQIGKRLFSKMTGVAAACLFLFSGYALFQFNTFWQPYLMQFFVNLSFLFLVLALKQEKSRPLFFSIITLTLAASIHNSAYALFPLYFVVIFLLFRKNLINLKNYISLLATWIASWFIFYFIPLVFSWKFLSSPSSKILESNFINFSGFWERLIENFSTYLSLFYYEFYSNRFLTLFGCLLLVFLFVIYITNHKNKNHLNYTMSIILAIASIFVFGTLLPAPMHLFYFMPIFGISLILLSHLFFDQIENKFILPKFVLFSFFFLLISTNFIPSSKPMTGQEADNLVHKLWDEINSTKENERYVRWDFFQIYIYKNSNGQFYGVHDAFLWAPLEKLVGIKFTKTDRTTKGYSATGSADYLFFGCQDSHGALCLEKFASEFRQYKDVKEIYESKTLILLKGRLNQ